MEDDYIALEQQLERRMANIESEFPGYDEYRYDVDTIGHDPNELISYLTAKFNAFTPAQVQAELQALFDQQYTLTTREEVQIRYRTVTWTDEEGNEHESEEAYEYYILHVSLTNRDITTIAPEVLTAEQLQMFRVYLETSGNSPCCLVAALRIRPRPQDFKRRQFVNGRAPEIRSLWSLQRGKSEMWRCAVLELVRI